MARPKITITGDKDIVVALEGIRRRIDDPEEISVEVAILMRKFAHVITGYLKSHIYHEGPYAVASAPYAEYEAARGGEHDFATRAADAWSIERYAKRIVEPW